MLPTKIKGKLQCDVCEKPQEEKDLSWYRQSSVVICRDPECRKFMDNQWNELNEGKIEQGCEHYYGFSPDDTY